MLSSTLWELIIGLLGGLGSLIIPGIIAVIIILVVHHDNKRRAAQLTNIPAATSGSSVPATTTPPTPAKLPKQKNPYALLNVLLICGSFFLVCAMISFMENTNNKLVAPTAITLTLIFYIIGAVIYKLVDYLKPVGLAFAYTATAVFPFWVISFITFGIDTQLSWILTSTISMIAFVITSLIFKSKVLPFFAYFWALVTAWACTPIGNETATIWWAFAAPGVLSFIPLLIYRGRPAWLPVNFRKATLVAAYILLPFVFMGSLILFVVPDIAIEAPFLRTFMSLLAIIYALLFWTNNHKYGWFIVGRFAVQILLFACVADSLNYSLFERLFDSAYSEKHLVAALSAVIVWAISFLAQALAALFLPKKNEEIRKAEHLVEVLSLIGIFITPIFTAGFDTEMSAVVQLVVFSILAVLGVAYSAIHKNILWSIATLVSLALIPLVISEGFDGITWSSWINIIYFTVYGLLILLGYKLTGKQQPNAMPLAIVGLCFTALVLFISAIDVGYVEVAWLIITLFLAAFGYLSKYTILYELSIYSGALCVFSLIGTIGETIFSNSNAMVAIPKCEVYGYAQSKCIGAYDSYSASRENLLLTLHMIRSFVLPTALIGVSVWKERKLPEKNRWRFFLGYILLTVSLLFVGWRGGDYWMLGSVLTQVAFLVYAVLVDKGWLVWTSIAVMLVSMLSLTGGFTYIWFGVIGIVLIMIVIWRLMKLNDAKKREEAKHSPAKPEEK
ncbi:MAG: hypothetical protein Q4D22_02435 [Candidatus Saccharibacteria bacterium]|nr:hypothetical protein [Candidatus Saccharibacteria bacterium]